MQNDPSREIAGLRRALQNSSTYQEWVQEGFEMGLAMAMEKGRVIEARAFLLRCAPRILGEPDAATLRTLEAITDPRKLRELTDRVIDGQAGSWAELLRPAT